MSRFNVLAPVPDLPTVRGGDRPGRVQVGALIGAALMRASFLDLEDGEPSGTYHFHHGVEEWLLVVSGSPSIRTPAGDRALRRGDLVCFPVGPGGAHQATGPGTVLIVSEACSLDAVEYPERGEVELRPSGRILHPASAPDQPRDGPADPVNVYDVAVEGDADDPPGYRARAARVGPAIAAERLGASVYELDPGQSVCPYHYEGVEEEWLLVLAGAAILRDPEGEHELAAGELACFPRGPAGGHKVTNRTDEVVRVLILSTIPEIDLSICVYPDSHKVGVWPWPGQRLRLAEPIGYYDGEI